MNTESELAELLESCRCIELTLTEGILYLTLNRPEKRNALDLPTLNEIIRVFEFIADHRLIRAVVIQGKGKHFCAGGDISEMQMQGLSEDQQRDAMTAVSRRFGQLSATVSQAPQVVIAKVQGAVLGGGFGIASVADLVIADSSVRFAMPETSLGIVPAQIAPFVMRRIGESQTRRLALLGLRINGHEAQTLGLVDYLLDSPEAATACLATMLKQLASCAPVANAVTKQLLQSLSAEPGLALEAMIDRAAHCFVDALYGAEGREGTAAFLQQRKPSWAVPLNDRGPNQQ